MAFGSSLGSCSVVKDILLWGGLSKMEMVQRVMIVSQ
jgi:hypothetical protein